MSRSSNQQESDHLILLIHGIRTHAIWQNQIMQTLIQAGLQCKPIGYGYFDVLRFLIPNNEIRGRPVDTILRQIRVAKKNWNHVSIVAHSFGTYIIARILEEETDIQLERVILCGSIVREDYPWHLRVQCGQVKEVLNDAGQRDIWPILAKVFTWGYGATGTFGIKQVAVSGDRIHSDLGHSAFLTPEFAKEYWVPFLTKGEVVPEKGSPTRPPWWKSIVTLPVLQPKYLILSLTIIAMLILSVMQISSLWGTRAKWRTRLEISSFRVENKGAVATYKDLSIYKSETGDEKRIYYGPYSDWGLIDNFKVHARIIEKLDLDHISARLSDIFTGFRAPDRGGSINEAMNGIFEFALEKGVCLDEAESREDIAAPLINEEGKAQIAVGATPRINKVAPQEGKLIMVYVEVSTKKEEEPKGDYVGKLYRYHTDRHVFLATTDDTLTFKKNTLRFDPPEHNPEIIKETNVVLLDRTGLDREYESRLFWEWNSVHGHTLPAMESEAKAGSPREEGSVAKSRF